MANNYKLTPLRRVVNAVVKATVTMGIAPKRTQMLGVQGRKSATWHTTPVNLVLREGNRYLVAPYGERSWVKNVRAAGEVTLRHGKTVEPSFVEPVAGKEAAAVLQQYWRENAITRSFFNVPPNSDEEAFLDEVPTHPVFRLRRAEEI